MTVAYQTLCGPNEPGVLGKLSAIGSGTARYSLRRHFGFDCDCCSSRLLSSSTENQNDRIQRVRAVYSTHVKTADRALRLQSIVLLLL